MTFLPTPIFAATYSQNLPEPAVLDGFAVGFQWYLLCGYNNTCLQSRKIEVSTSTRDFLQMIP